MSKQVAENMRDPKANTYVQDRAKGIAKALGIEPTTLNMGKWTALMDAVDAVYEDGFEDGFNCPDRVKG